MSTEDRIQEQAQQLERQWAHDERWAGIERTYGAEEVVRLRGSVVPECTLGAARRRAALAPAHAGGLRERARRDDRRPGRPDGARPACRRSTSPAGRSPPTRTSRGHVPRPEPLPGELGAAGRPPAEQRTRPRRPDRLVGGPERHRLVRADRRRRGGGLRRRAQRVRVDARDDRGGCRRRALRGPARRGEEVRPSRRQGAGADVAVHPDADRGTARGRRARTCRRSSSHGRTR